MRTTTHPTPEEFRFAQAIIDSDPVICTYAATEWDCLHDDGKAWLAVIIREAMKAASFADALTTIDYRMEHMLEAKGDGFWQSCTGCHETNEGQETGHYPYNAAMKCFLGSGCTECGGIGAIWDNTDYSDLAAFSRARDRDHDNIKRILVEQGDLTDFKAEQVAMAISDLEIPPALIRSSKASEAAMVVLEAIKSAARYTPVGDGYYNPYNSHIEAVDAAVVNALAFFAHSPKPSPMPELQAMGQEFDGRDYVTEKLYDDLNDILSPFHWEAWQAALFSDLDHWPEEDEQAAIASGVDGVAVGEHFQAWSEEVRTKIIALFAAPPKLASENGD